MALLLTEQQDTYKGEPSMLASERAPGEVESLGYELESAITRLEVQWSETIQRLSNVIREEPMPEVAKKEEITIPPSTKLGRSLNDSLTRVNSLSHGIRVTREMLGN